MEREAKIAGAGPLTDFEVGQRVMTVEGYPGTVSDVHEGPADLTTVYVTLDNGMGGGEYAEAELQPLNAQSTAARNEAAIAEAGVTHTAADDYPELGTILSDRLPPTIQQRMASKTAGAAWTHADDEDYDDDLATGGGAPWVQCSGCGAWYPEDEPEGDQHDHWTAKQALYLPPVPQAEQRASTTDLPASQRAGYAEGYEQGKAGITREPSQPEDLDFMAGYDIGWAEGVTVHREPANSWDIDDLGRDQTADVPSTIPSAFGPTMASFTEISGSASSTFPVDLGMPTTHEAALPSLTQWIEDNAQPGEYPSYDWCRFRRNSQCWLPKGLHEQASREAGYAVWVPQNRGPCPRTTWSAQEKCPTGAPGPNVDGGYTDATVSWEQGGQRNGVPGTVDADPSRYASVHPLPGAHEFEPNPDEPHLCFVCGAWRYSHPGEKPTQVAAGLVREAAFEFTAAWKDVRAKAKRIRESGGVRIAASHDNVIVGHIKGDNGVYETEIVSFPGKRNAATWSCGCKWSSYSWGR